MDHDGGFGEDEMLDQLGSPERLGVQLGLSDGCRGRKAYDIEVTVHPRLAAALQMRLPAEVSVVWSFNGGGIHEMKDERTQKSIAAADNQLLLHSLSHCDCCGDGRGGTVHGGMRR